MGTLYNGRGLSLDLVSSPRVLSTKCDVDSSKRLDPEYSSEATRTCIILADGVDLLRLV